MNLHTDNGNRQKKKTRDNITEVRAKTLRANMTKVATPNHLCLVNPTHTDLHIEQFFSI